MIEDDLIQLSFEQLEEIQNRINQVISDKRSARLSAAIKDVLYLLNNHYPDVSLWDFLTELANLDHDSELAETSISIDLGTSTELDHPLEMAQDCEKSCPETVTSAPSYETLQAQNLDLTPPKSPEASPEEIEEVTEVSRYPSVQDEDPFLLPDPEIFYGRLKAIRNETLQHEDARLLWLTNDGSQKTSKVSGKALAELLQETLKKLERLCDSEVEMDKEILNREVLRISEWGEFHLGVSLRRGTLTVITPFAARDISGKGYSSMLTIADMQQKMQKDEVQVPFSQYQYR